MVSSIFKKNFWQATKGSAKTRSASDSSQDNNHKKTRVKTNEAKAKPMEHWHAMVNKLNCQSTKKTSVRKTREGPMPKVPVRAAGAERNRERTKVMIAKRSKAKITEMM